MRKSAVVRMSPRQIRRHLGLDGRESKPGIKELARVFGSGLAVGDLANHAFMEIEAFARFIRSTN